MDSLGVGFLDKLLQAAKSAAQPETSRSIAFDSDWEDSWEALRQEIESNGGGKVMTSVTFPDGFFEELTSVIETHKVSEMFPYAETKTPIEIVGESFYQDAISEFCNRQPGEDLGWVQGFLVPEMANSYDKTAVAIYVVKRTEPKADNLENDLFAIVHAGYLAKETARKVHKKILHLLGLNQYIPLLIRIHGGTEKKPNYGVFAFAMSEKIDFPD